MSSILPVNNTPNQAPTPPKKPPQNTANQRISAIAHKALQAMQTTTYKGALILAKAIAIPLQLALLAAVAAAAALSVLVSLPLRLVVDTKSSLTPFHHMASTIDGIWEVVKITYHLGEFPDSERTQLADDKPDSPKFVRITPSTLSSKPPILYAPGYLDSPDTLRDTCRQLAEDLQTPVYIVKYRSRFQSIEEHTKDIARVEERIIADTERNDVILIGHSMGGINTGRYIQQLDPEQVKVKLWITLASPLEGTPLAKFGIGKCTQDMHPDSDVIDKIQSQVALDKIPSLHVYTLTDGVVPARSASGGPKGTIHATYQCQQPYSHLGMRSKPEVDAEIKSAILKYSAFQSPHSF